MVIVRSMVCLLAVVLLDAAAKVCSEKNVLLPLGVESFFVVEG